MNKSVEFIKNRIINNPEFLFGMPINGWEDAIIFSPIKTYQQHILNMEIVNDTFMFILRGRLENGFTGETKITIHYDPNEEYEYFTSKKITYDGTCMFLEECIIDILNRPLTLQTYDKTKVDDDFLVNPFNYNIKYTIGDIVVHRDFGMKNINNCNMYGETDIAVLPIKMTIIKKS